MLSIMYRARANVKWSLGIHPKSLLAPGVSTGRRSNYNPSTTMDTERNMTELEQLALTALARPASQAAIEFERQWSSWGDMRAIADTLSAALDRAGVSSGANVALIARNQPSALAAFLGLIAHRYSIRMIYPFQSSTAIAREIADIAPAAVVANADDFSEELCQSARARGIAGVQLSGMKAAAVTGLEHSTIRSSLAGEPTLEILTSGTTGKPKPFAMSFNAVATHIVLPRIAQMQGQAEKMPPTLMYFPVGNISGLHATLAPLLSGNRCVLLERFSLEGWHEHLLRFRPYVCGLPPAGIQMVLDADLPVEDLSCLAMIGTGAAPLDSRAHKAFEEKYGIPVLLSYGATEFAGPVAAMTLELHAQWGKQKFGSVGRAMPGASLRVVDADSGEPLAAGKEGILEVITPRIGPDWIRTTDMAVIDEDGFLFHCGRADGAIVRGGFKLLPETIERALLEHPAVSAAAVVGLDDRRLGQVPVAVIAPKPDCEAPSVDELEAHLRQRVLATHIPVDWRIVKELPRTRLSFKVDQSAVRELFQGATTGF